MLVATAFLWASRSTCSRLHVGAVLHRDGRILVQGYNGAASGLLHCDHECDCGESTWIPGHPHDAECKSVQPCSRAVHAEANAIAFAARWGISTEGSELVVTHQPCLSCAMLIINAGIKSVIFAEPYRLQDGVEMLKEAGVTVLQTLYRDGGSLIGSDS